MAQRISEQVAEYLTLGGDGFTSQTSVPLHVQGHTILGDTTTNNNSDNYKANLTTINGHLIINASYNNHNNYSQGIRINKGSDNRALLMLGGDTGSTEGTNDMTWYIGSFPTSGSSSTTDLIIARNDYQFNNKKPSLQLDNNGLVVYKNLQIKSTMGNDTGFSLYGGNTTDSTPALYGSLLIATIGTTSTTGVTRLQLGNNTASGSNNNARGSIRLYGSSTQYSDIYSSVNTNNTTLYLPNANGWLIVGGNGSNLGVGSSSQPIYISTDGIATAITGTINNNAKTATGANITTTTNAVAYYTNTSGTFGTKASANGALYATSANGSLNWGTLPVGQGGTGATSFTSNYVLVGNGSSAIQARSNLQVPSSGNITSKASIVPNSNNTIDLGSSSSKWATIYTNFLFADSLARREDSFIIAPKGGSLNIIQDNQIGILQIQLPTNDVFQNTMLNFYIDIYDYDSKTVATYHVCGYTYSSKNWYNTNAVSIGAGLYANLPVRFYHNNTDAFITIGELTTSWSFVKVIIRNVQIGQSHYSLSNSNVNWNVGWSITLATATPSSGILDNTIQWPLRLQSNETIFSYQDNGLFSKKDTASNIGYQLENNQTKLSLLIDNLGTGGLYDPNNNSWILSINKDRSLLAVKQSTVLKVGELRSYYVQGADPSVTTCDNNLRNLFSMKQQDMPPESGIYITMIKIVLTSSNGTHEFFWNGILPWFNPGDGYGYSTDYTLAVGGPDLKDDIDEGVGTNYLNIYFRPSHSTYGSFIRIKSFSDSLSFGVNTSQSKITLLKISDIY